MKLRRVWSVLAASVCRICSVDGSWPPIREMDTLPGCEASGIQVMA